MNYDLMTKIIQHVMANLVISKSDFVNIDKSKSLLSKDLLLKEKLNFEEDGIKSQNNIWGCQISAEQQEIKILVGDCTQDKNLPEYCLLVQLKDAPAYGLYLMFTETFDESMNPEPMIAVSVNNKDWMECSTYLQATFLAGMEQIRDLGLAWSKCTNYNDTYALMLSFIKFHNQFYEAAYEGQED
jgi:hypothetical protein